MTHKFARACAALLLLVPLSANAQEWPAKQPLKIIAIGGDPAPMSPSEFDSVARKEIATNAEIVKASGIPKN
jgi:hypothetical protein